MLPAAAPGLDAAAPRGDAVPPAARAGVRLADMVQAQLRRLIDRGEFPRDCKLPTEAALCARFGVSRPVLRDALQRLKDEGVLASRRGSGTVVLRGASPGAALLPPVRTAADLLRAYEFRLMLEGATAAFAAERHNRETLAGIAAALDAAEAAIDHATPQLAGDANFAFHRAVARAAGNPYCLAVVENFPNFVGAVPVVAASFGDEPAGLRMRRVLDEHLAIFAAIRARNAALARAEMESHIIAARDHVLERRPLA